MTKAKKEEIIKRFEGRDLNISRVKKFYGFIVVNYSDIYWCYERPSYYKVKAYDYCQELRAKVCKIEGVDLFSSGIVSFNKMQFSYVINFMYQGKRYSYYITKDYNTLYAEE